MMYPSPTPWSPYRPAPVTSEEGPAPEQQHGLWPGRYIQISGIVVIALTALAILAAILGPVLATQATPLTAPSNWRKAYDSNLQNNTDWSGGSCHSGSNGLDTTGDSGNAGLCTFAPSTSIDLVSQGFQLNLSLAPESQLQNPLLPVIQISDNTGSTGLFVVLDDAGNYAICPDLSGDCSSSSLASTAVKDSTVAWHTDSYVANTLALRYQPNSDGGSGLLTFFINGEEVRTVSTSANLSGGFAISIGADAGGEALYTDAMLYTASN